MTEVRKKTAPVYGLTSTEAGFCIFRDGAPLQTPARATYYLPTKALAEAVVREWQAQTDKINPASMPLTQLTATTVDKVSTERLHMTEQLLSYLDSELLCHRADQPDYLIAQQHKEWQPLLDWCEEKFGIKLRSGHGIMPVRQLPEARTGLKTALDVLDDFRFTGLRQAAEVCGSLILGLALLENHLTPQQIIDTAEIETRFQMQKWGEDPDILKKQAAALDDLKKADQWLKLLG